jgi:hypothetical protein
VWLPFIDSSFTIRAELKSLRFATGSQCLLPYDFHVCLAVKSANKNQILVFRSNNLIQNTLFTNPPLLTVEGETCVRNFECIRITPIN